MRGKPLPYFFLPSAVSDQLVDVFHCQFPWLLTGGPEQRHRRFIYLKEFKLIYDYFQLIPGFQTSLLGSIAPSFLISSETLSD